MATLPVCLLSRRPAWADNCKGRYSLYSFRKAHGSRLSLAGFPVRHAAALMGHSTKTHPLHCGETDARAAQQLPTLYSEPSSAVK